MFSVTEYGVRFAKQYRAEQIARAEQHRLTRQARPNRETSSRTHERHHVWWPLTQRLHWHSQ